MKLLFALLYTLLPITASLAQKPASGNCDGINIAYNPNTNKITGYFFSTFPGYDETTEKSRFSCIFYLEGKLINDTAIVNTYYPEYKGDDQIKGILKINNSAFFSLSLPQDHGGCRNVQPFTKGAVEFSIFEKQNWIEIRYVMTDKAYLSSDKRNVPVRKYSILYIERIEGEFAYCKYYGRKTAEGWIPLSSLNKL